MYTKRIKNELTDLEGFIDHYHLQNKMDPEPGKNTPNPKRKKTDSSTDTDDLRTTEVEVSLLASIN